MTRIRSPDFCDIMYQPLSVPVPLNNLISKKRCDSDNLVVLVLDTATETIVARIEQKHSRECGGVSGKVFVFDTARNFSTTTVSLPNSGDLSGVDELHRRRTRNSPRDVALKGAANPNPKGRGMTNRRRTSERLLADLSEV